MNILKTTSLIDKEIMISCAFRYALGRKTYVVSSVVETILFNWESLSPALKNAMVEEINEYKKRHGSIGMEMDESDWMKIIIKNNEGDNNGPKNSTT